MSLLVTCTSPDAPSQQCAPDALEQATDDVLQILTRAEGDRSTSERVVEAEERAVDNRGQADRAELRSSLTETLATAVLKHAIVEELGYDVYFLIATLADACDSFTGGAFDPALESIRRAIEVGGYVQDRFFFPDWTPGTSPNQPGSQCRGRLHEQHPGVVIFRHEKETSGRGSLLVLFTVPETATAGIHAAALVRAIWFISQWNRALGVSPTWDKVRVIGPTFSGTSASLRRTLDGLPPGLATGYAFDIVSGSATASSNAAGNLCSGARR